jgi:hypothetical protein
VDRVLQEVNEQKSQGRRSKRSACRPGGLRCSAKKRQQAERVSGGFCGLCEFDLCVLGEQWAFGLLHDAGQLRGLVCVAELVLQF